MRQKSTFLLADIHKALIDGIFTLPTIQRGFVWKPYQIENLWDSLLRGYPVGSVVLSPEKNSENKFAILDGQQRLSSICLGMYNSNETKEVFKTSYDSIRIFIDLVKPEINDNRKYIFRVITTSQPWGYQRVNNQKILESKNKRFFLETIENKENLFKKVREGFYPFDAYKPVPFEFFFNSNHLEEVRSKIQNWNHNNKRMINKKSRKQDLQSYTEQEILSAVKDMKANVKIPALYLNLSKMYANEINDTKDNKNSDAKAYNQRLDEIENMFVRLNAGGTPLTAEELNYSVLKSNIHSNLQKEIEEQCIEICNPARFITIAYRLFEMKDQKQRNFYRLTIKPKVFQRNIKKIKTNTFPNFIKKILHIDQKEPNKNSLLLTVKKILTYENKKNKYGLPFLTVYKLSSQSPEVMFMLLYRLYIKGDSFENNGPSNKRKMIGIITLFSWFGKGKQRDHSQLLRNIFPAMVNLDQSRFWSWETIERAHLTYNDKDVLTSFPLFEDLEKAIEEMVKKNKTRRNSGLFDQINNELKPFIKTMFENKHLLLYAQRNYLSKKFNNSFFLSDDTSVPFDWDHIFPHDFIKNKRGITKSLKDWYHSNGNFWACPYELNRSFHDASPCNKFLNKKILKDAFIDEKSLEKCRIITDKDCLKKHQKIVYKFILNRNLSLCKKWYDSLKIDELNPHNIVNVSKESEKDFDNYFNLTKFKQIDDDSEFIDYRELKLDKNLYFYIGVYDPKLLEEGIQFGIMEIEGDILRELDEKEDYNIERDGNDYYLYKNFTLTSDTKESYQDLIMNIRDWLLKSPEPYNKDWVNIFEKALKKNTRIAIN